MCTCARLLQWAHVCLVTTLLVIVGILELGGAGMRLALLLAGLLAKALLVEALEEDGVVRRDKMAVGKGETALFC